MGASDDGNSIASAKSTDRPGYRRIQRGVGFGAKHGDLPTGTELFGRFAAEVGPSEALQRIASLGSASPRTSPAFDQDVQWDILRADMLQRSGNLTAAAAAVDALMPDLAKLPPKEQIALLRETVDIYGRIQPSPSTDKTIHIYEQIVDRSPQDLPSLNNLAWLLLDQAVPPQPARALEYSQRAFKEMSQNGHYDPEIADTHGWALANNGKYTEAIDLLGKVVQQIPSPQTEDHLGETYLLAGHPTEARAHLNSALDLLKTAEKNGQTDPTLHQRLQAALQRAVDTKPAQTTAG